MRKKMQYLLHYLAISFLTLSTGIYAPTFAQQAGKIIGKAKLRNHTEGDMIFRPDLKVSENGGIKYVVITLEGATGEFKTDPIEIDQQEKVFVPRISVTMAGNEVTFKNSDGILHNAHTYYGNDTYFNVAMPAFLKTYTHKLTQPGILKVTCDVHENMLAYVVVTNNPYYAISNAAGLFAIDSVPPGTYKIKAWHEKLGTIVKKVTVMAGKTTAITFEFPYGN